MNNITVWYSKLMTAPDDFQAVMDAYNHYMVVYEEASKEANDLAKGGDKMLSSVALKLPGIAAYRYAQLQEIEQILGFLENREKRLLGVKRRQFREHYARELTDSMVEKYAETDPDLLDMAETRNFFALVRNKFLALTKQHEYLHYSIANIAKLRDKGIEGAVLA